MTSIAQTTTGQRSWLKSSLKYSGIFLVVLLFAAGFAYLLRYDLIRLYEDLPAYSHDAGSEQHYQVSMRDGVKLATDVFQPEGVGPWPTVLIRNPYAQMGLIVQGWCGRFVRYGYACVYQQVRGQGDSEGEWLPMVNEVNDGEDALQWLIKQDFQDQNVAMVGPSYLAAVQWAAAGNLPQQVKTFVPAVYTTNNREVLYQDGMFRHETFTAWAATMRKSGGTEGNSEDEQLSIGEKYQQALRHRPHVEVDEKVFGVSMPWYRDWVTSPDPSDEFWQRADNVALIEVPKNLKVPVLMIAGWYDVFFGPQFKDWQNLATRSESRLVIGPWTHAGSGGEALETPGAEGGLMQWPLMLDWLDGHLKGTELQHPPGVSAYVMRDNQWSDYQNWPPQTQSQRWFLTDADAANACDGGGLQRQSSAQGQQVQYQYDPDQPVPTRGGSGMLAFLMPGFKGSPAANMWQQGLCERADVISFVSTPFDQAQTIAGEISVTLTVASDAADTAFTAKLVELMPDGRAVNIRDSITSLAYRNQAQSKQEYQPGQAVTITLPFWPIQWTVPKGSRLRLDISSSDFPKFHAHPNKPGIWSEQVAAVVAQQTVFAGGQWPAWVDLPILTKQESQVAIQ